MFPMSRRIAILGAPFTPKSIGGLVLWLRADDISGNDGDAVAAWADRSGNGNNFAQAVGGSQPLLKKTTNGINGHNTVLFDGTASHLLAASVFDSSMGGSIFGIFRFATAMQAGVLISSCDEASDLRFMCIDTSRVQLLKYYVAFNQRNNDAQDASRGSTEEAINTSYLGGWFSDGSAWSCRVNGAAQTITVMGGGNNGDWFGDTANRDNFCIGAQKINSGIYNYIKGDIAEIIMYNTALTAKQIAQVEKYLAALYGITL